MVSSPISNNPTDPTDIQSNIDKGLIAMFLKMSVEERLSANDNAVRTIQELKKTFRETQYGKGRTKRNS